jgi:uncharacterized protein
MKIRYSDRRNWDEKIKFESNYVENEQFTGYITISILEEIQKPLCWKVPEGIHQNLCIADVGYRWIQFYPKDKWYSVIAILDDKLEFVQFYVDLVMPYDVEEGVVVTRDLYLDYFIDWDGNYIELDIDEYQEAMLKGELPQDLAHKAQEVFDQIAREIKEGSFPPAFIKNWVEEYTNKVTV